MSGMPSGTWGSISLLERRRGADPGSPLWLRRGQSDRPPSGTADRSAAAITAAQSGVPAGSRAARTGRGCTMGAPPRARRTPRPAVHYLVLDRRFAAPVYVFLDADPRRGADDPGLPVREVTLDRGPEAD